MKSKIAWMLLEALVVSLCVTGLVTLICSFFYEKMESGRVVLLLLLTFAVWMVRRIIVARNK